MTDIATAIITSVASIIVALIAGLFGLQAARIKTGKKDEYPEQQKASWVKVVLWFLLVGVLAGPFGCMVGALGNSLGGTSWGSPPTFVSFEDPGDPALISGMCASMLCVASFAFGVIITILGAFSKKKRE